MSYDIGAIPSSTKIKEIVEHLKDWLEKQPHLPNIEDEEWIKTFLYNNKFSVEKTKIKMDAYYSLKNKYPSILKNRDPCSQEVLRAKQALILCSASKLTKDGYRLLYNKFDSGPELLNFTSFMKRVFMVADMFHLEQNRLTNYIVLADCQNIKYQHFLRLAPELATLSEILSKAYTERVVGLHMINVPSFIFKMVDFMKRHLPEKLGSRIYVHSSESDISLCDFIDEDVLSCDYGGKGQSIAECDDSCQKLLEKHASWFKEQDNVCSDESLRMLGVCQFEELTGSFRTLDID